MPDNIVPFWLNPMSWLLKGKERERARLVYEKPEGPELDRALLSHDYEPDTDEYVLRLIDLDYRDGLLSDYDRDIAQSEIKHKDEESRTIAKINIDFDNGKITEQEAEKRTATAKKEAWVGGPMSYVGDGGVLFDLDWNEYWIEELKQNGYTGDTDQMIMNKWFAALHYSEVINQHGGADMDPFLYETARAALNKIIGRDE